MVLFSSARLMPVSRRSPKHWKVIASALAGTTQRGKCKSSLSESIDDLLAMFAGTHHISIFTQSSRKQYVFLRLCIVLFHRRLMLRILTSCLGLSFLSTLTSSMRLTTSMPASTFPKTVCLRSNQGVGTVVIKN